jgi:hypothetical protein
MIRNTILALVFAASATRTTHAQPNPTEDARQVQARAYFDRGNAHYKAGRYLEARAEFAAGYELSRRPLFLFNMAECSRLDGNLELAREGYERYLREAPTGSEAALAKQRLAALAQTLTAPGPQPNVDPRPTAPPPVVTPAPRPAAPTVVAPSPVPQPTPPPVQAPATPHIAMSAPTNASPPASTSASTVCLGDSCDQQDQWPQKRILGLGVGSAGVGFIAIGIGYWRRSVSRGDLVTAACASGCDWNAVKGTYDESQSARTAEWLFLGLGTVAAVAGGYFYYVGTQERRHPRFAVAPRPDGAAITWSGSW